MTGKAGWMLAGSILVAMGSTAQAQVGISIGNPYNGRGIVIGNPGYRYGGYNSYYAPATTYYNSGYAGYAPAYNSGYAGYAPPVVYSRPYVVRNYGYRPYGNGYGYRPYRRGYGRRW